MKILFSISDHFKSKLKEFLNKKANIKVNMNFNKIY